MVITLTPQWRTILPMLIAALLYIIFALVVAALVAVDRIRARDMERMQALLRSGDTEKSEGDR